MDVGLALPQYDYSVPGDEPLGWATVVDWATRAEALGFGSLWLADHLFLGLEKYGAPPGNHFGYDPLLALGALARCTTAPRLGTLVVCSQLRPAAVLAKSLATVDVLSGGRLVAGLGAGWFEPEFEAAGVAFDRPGVRLAQMVETAEVLRGVWTGEPFTYDGAHHHTDALIGTPSPVQQPPPIWFGGRGDRLLAAVARAADGWNTVWSFTPEQWRARDAVLVEACERVGRDPATVSRSIGLTTLVGEDEADLRRRYQRLQARSPKGVLDGVRLEDWRVGRLVGTVQQVREQLMTWTDLGISTVVACLGAVPFAVSAADDLDPLASAIT